MQVGDLVRWADSDYICGIVTELFEDQAMVLFFNRWDQWLCGREWCFQCDLEIVKSE